MSYINGGGGSSSGGSAIQTITGNSGGAVGPTLNNINLIGTGGLSFVGTPGTSTITGTLSGTGITWNVITASSASMAVNNGYITNNAGVVTLTLPTTAAIGSTIQVTDLGAGGWSIAQNAGQQINFGLLSTTAGTGGSLSSINQFDSVEMVCVVADTTFNVLSSIGNLTVA